MEQRSSGGTEIEQVIYDDLIALAQHAGLKNPRFGTSRLIRAGLLPGDHRQQVSIYCKLILKNIESVEPQEVRESLCVKLNLRDGYPDSGSQERLRLLGGKWGRAVARDSDGKRRSKRTEDQAREGQKFLASLIYKEIILRNEHKTWNELLQGTTIEPASEPLQLSAVPKLQALTPTAIHKLETSRAGVDVGPLPPREEVMAVSIAPAVLEALEMARAACKAAERKFVTPHLLLALLDMPNSRVSHCFDQAKPGLARKWQEFLREYQNRAISDEKFGEYLGFDWNGRRDVWRAKEIAWQDEMVEVNELYLLLGVLDNQRSKTRRELAEYLGMEDFKNLCRVSDRMREADDTPGSTLGYSDDAN